MIKKNFTKKLFLAFSIFFFCSFFQKEEKKTYTYDEYIGKTKFQTTWTVEKKDDKILIEGEEKNAITKLICKPSFEIENYSFEIKDEKTNYEISKDKNILHLKGLSKNKKIEKKFNIKNTPWIQQLSFGLIPFMASKKKSLKFYIVNPRDFSLIKMVVKKQNLETLSIKDKKYKAQKIKVTLPGIKKFFWKAYLYFDTETNDFLKYVGNTGPNTPIKTTLLNSKK